MHLTVKVRELNLPGRKPLYKGDAFEIDEMAGKTLKLVGKAEDPPKHHAPVGHVASTEAPEPQPEPEQPGVEPEVEPAIETEAAAQAPPRAPYRNRRLKTED